MKKSFVALLNVTFILSLVVVAENSDKIPDGWYPAGSNYNEYEMGIDRTISQSGQACAYIKSKKSNTDGFGTLMQSISAENYFGKRLQLSGYIKSENVEGWSGMWMRIDAESNESLGFDNMQDRAIQGTTDWNKYEIVLDVPLNSNTILFGVLLGGDGKVWFDNFELKEVDKNVPITDIRERGDRSTEPKNLDFE
ncbi:MAG: hypothetical protein HKP17_10370 [Ignavibacteriaceae bacterium]|nr:hypothetical protein [Ignavibacteriaceae bacterium]